MQLISSMISLVKNVNETDREFKILKEKLNFNIMKAEGALNKFERERHVESFVADNLTNRLRDAKEQFANLETLLSSSSSNETLSLKDKIRLSLPFNNFREKIVQCIEDLKQATDEVINGTLGTQNLPAKRIASSLVVEKKEVLSEPEIDNEIENMYDMMGPTIQENNAYDLAQQFKRHTISLEIEMMGNGNLVEIFELNRRIERVEKSCDRISKEQRVQLYTLGRMNFKNEYKKLKPLYPDIDKISKLSHFKIYWKRNVDHDNQENKVINHESKQPLLHKTKEENQPEHQELSEKKSPMHSQKKEEGHEQFFSVPEVISHLEDNGHIIVEKENRVLLRKQCQQWVKVEEECFEITNGQCLAISLKGSEPELYFKIRYHWS